MRDLRRFEAPPWEGLREATAPGGAAQPAALPAADRDPVPAGALERFFETALVRLHEMAAEANAATCAEWLDLDLELWRETRDPSHHLLGHRDGLRPFRLSLAGAEASGLPFPLRPWHEVVFAAVLGMARVAGERLARGRGDLPSANDVLPLGAGVVRDACVPRWNAGPEYFYASESLVALAVFHLLVAELGPEIAVARASDLQSLSRSTFAEFFRRDLTGALVPPPRAARRAKPRVDFDA